MTEKNDLFQKTKSENNLNNQKLNDDNAEYIQNLKKPKNVSQNTENENAQHKSFSEYLDCLINSSREQHLNSEQQIQKTLNQASTILMDSERLQNLYDDAIKLQKAAQMGISNLQANAGDYFKIIDNMENLCHKQQIAMDLQIFQAMQQAVMALAQAQNTLLSSQTINEMYDILSSCRDNLTKILEQQQPQNPTVQ